MAFSQRLRRSRPRVRARRPAATVKQKFPATYRQNEFAFKSQWDALADAGTVAVTLVDNSAIAGNKMIKIVKLKLEWSMLVQSTADVCLRVAVLRHTEGTLPTDLDQANVRDARNENRLLRGPWMLPLMGVTSGSQPTLYKPLILKNIVLDANDDLSLFFENMTGNTLSATGPHFYALIKYWYRVVS